MKNIYLTLFLYVTLSFLVARVSFAQEVEATVSVSSDNLPQAARDEIAGFAEELRAYINTRKWTELEWQGPKLKITFGINLVNVAGNYYKAKLLVGSQRTLANGSASPMLKLIDDELKNSNDDGWSFPYRRGQQLYSDPTGYNEITSLVDFYVYTALGLDFDSYAKLSGDAMYSKALHIANSASARGLDGWSANVKTPRYSRLGFIKELTDIRYQPLRNFIFDYHYNCLDVIDKNRVQTLDSINNLLSGLVLSVDKLVEPTLIVKILSDSKYQEFASLFKGHPDPLVWKKLKYIDPGHTLYFDETQNGR